ncbi:MAG: site-specific DNA-methyltransferase [Bacteroidales bacterium]|nr:site-specific DNA-methyltransferase [Bacteroidales bacterium]MDD4107199.1 site-specific DNA-methyltransferase [Prolixibacteraceae bacterium]
MAQDKLQKLELTWIGKDDKREPVEPRILIENPKYSHGVSESGNMLIHGDNLLALKALEAEYSGRVKCIYIDPPYNTGNAFEHYDDGLEHSIWLDLMCQRIKILHALLSNDGAFCMHLDDGEVHYAKVICDEIFGRSNFIATVAIRSSTPSGVKTAHKNKKLIKQKDLMLVYKKSELLIINPQYVRKDSWDTHFNYFANKDSETVEPLINVLIRDRILQVGDKLGDFNINNPKHRKFYVENADYICQTQSFKNDEIKNASRKYANRIYFVNKGEYNEMMFYNGRQLTPLKNSMNEIMYYGSLIEDISVLLCDFWSDIDFQNTQNEGGVDFPNSKKPETMVYRVFSLFSNPGDLVLDSFLGSGTTAAVAHKMGRRWIGVELGDHAMTHCYPRLKQVVDGTDQSGISKAQNWKGGGGFKFYELAPSLLNKDSFGNFVINKEYNADMLAAAMAKQEGFTYLPDTTIYWKQGKSSEQDFIFTTTQFLTLESLDAIHDQMAEGESLLICCTAFQKECSNRYSNITIKKIPQMLLGRCEFGKDDYSLNIINLPKMEEDPDSDTEEEDTLDDSLLSASNQKAEQTLFD